VIVLPISRVGKGIPFHVEVKPPEAGLTVRSFIKCEELRSNSEERLTRRFGEVSERTEAFTRHTLAGSFNPSNRITRSTTPGFS
jgi:mRNA interferase MazF